MAGGEITAEQAELAARIPLAQEITVEADSGGHTDNRPAMALFPTIRSLASRLETKYGYERKLRVGLAGGISTPAAAAAAFAMGAAYVMTGSVNQACIESGTSEEVRQMLAETRQADVTMAPAADMFEMGVTVQVLKRGTMFPMRAAKLYETLPRLRQPRRDPACRTGEAGKDPVPRPAGGYLAGNPRLFPQPRPAPGGARRAGPEAPHGPRLPLVSGTGGPLGERWRNVPPHRLPDLVRPGHGRIQRMGRRFLSGSIRPGAGL